jgi:GxxExxY protein
LLLLKRCPRADRRGCQNYRGIVENKAVDQLLPIHEVVLVRYLKMRDLHIGFLLNWNVILMKHGINVW